MHCPNYFCAQETSTSCKLLMRLVVLLFLPSDYTGMYRPVLCVHLSFLWAAFSTALKPSASYQYQAEFLFATIIAMNAMACRIFRLLRKHMVDDGNVHLIQMSTIHVGANPLKGVVAHELITEMEIPYI